MLTRLRFWWYTRDYGDLAFYAALGCVLAAFAGIARFAYVDNAGRRVAEHRNAEITCLAENVYHEARGEPLAGQYAVAEVTMNRVASLLFPDSVCEVVHAQRFDPIRRRYVGAFSWTELDRVRPPRGQAWRSAHAVATDVYDNPRDAPVVDGALYYHATYVSPAWAKTRARVAQIGTHIFYE